jgi:hypothetical protein
LLVKGKKEKFVMHAYLCEILMILIRKRGGLAVGRFRGCETNANIKQGTPNIEHRSFGRCEASRWALDSLGDEECLNCDFWD